MIKIESNWLELRYLDDLALQNTLIHRIDPCVKLITTLTFIVIVNSFSKYEIIGILPLLFYPIALISLGNIPYIHLLKRLTLIAPFVIFVGLFNPFFDRIPFQVIGPFVITGGWVSFLSINIKLLLSASAALILVATTGINSICLAMFRLGVPKPIVVQILFMYRYIHVLIEEFIRTAQAYQLRFFHGDSIHYKVWGSLLGQLLIRTFDRAQRIYQAMLCRGFDGNISLSYKCGMQNFDRMYLGFWVLFFLSCRIINIPLALGKLLMEGLL